MKRWMLRISLCLIALGVACVVIWNMLGPLPVARILGFCPIDQKYPSATGTREVRVLITDGGATGYGSIFVYSDGRLLFKNGPAVAETKEYSVRWIADDLVEVRYTNPHVDRTMIKRIQLH